MSSAVTIKVPGKHARDWLSGYDGAGAEEVDSSARTITLRLDDAALRDLISHTHYYAEEMGPDNTDDIDYRPAAKTLIRAFDRLGLKYTIRHFSVQNLDTSTLIER